MGVRGNGPDAGQGQAQLPAEMLHDPQRTGHAAVDHGEGGSEGERAVFEVPRIFVVEHHARDAHQALLDVVVVERRGIQETASRIQLERRKSSRPHL